MSAEKKRAMAVCWVLAIIGFYGMFVAVTAEGTSGTVILVGSK
jgi:hypothetical protein